MRLSTVLASVNNNRDYYMFIPKQILFWKKFGIRFLAVFVGDKIPDELNEYNENIILWSKNLDIHSAYLGQNLRMYYGALIDLPDDELLMITDIDMLPCSPKYYTEGLEHFSKNDFIYYRHIDGNQIYMCYNAAHPSVWGKCFGIKTVDDIENKIKNNYLNSYNGIPGSFGWYIDQEVMYTSLINYPFLKVLNRPLRRLETWMYNQHLQNGDSQFIHLYDDAHFHRSYFMNETYILNAEKQI